jgi:hypothetical protein
MDKSGYDFRIQRAEIDKEDIKYFKQWNHCRPVLCLQRSICLQRCIYVVVIKRRKRMRWDVCGWIQTACSAVSHHFSGREAEESEEKPTYDNRDLNRLRLHVYTLPLRQSVCDSDFVQKIFH